MSVINELGGEKIDVIEWKDDPEKFIANALAPAKILEVKIDKKNTAKVSVPEDQLSLAIGKDGRNVRLAANLTGWKIDIERVTEVEGAEKETVPTEPGSEKELASAKTSASDKSPSFAKATEGKSADKGGSEAKALLPPKSAGRSADRLTAGPPKADKSAGEPPHQTLAVRGEEEKKEKEVPKKEKNKKRSQINNSLIGTNILILLPF
jgi:hypothetical protein